MAYTFRSLFALGVVLSILATSPALAQMYNAGDPCPETTPGRIFTQEGAAGPALVCNGTTLEVYESIKTGPMRKGVGTANPAAMLDVAGEAKIGNTSLACSATTEGAMRYNSTSKEMEYCNGTAWGSLAPAAGGTSCYGPSCKPPGYFVITNGSWTGNLGGRSGADTKCLSDLTANNWRGKSEASARGLLDAAHVKAFLCDSSSCAMGQPFTRYYFAVSNAPDVSGAYFETDGEGAGPADNSISWSGVTVFDASYSYYWTGRSGGSTNDRYASFVSGVSTCSNWSTTSGNGIEGQSGSGYSRWSYTSSSCGLSGVKLICFVHPTP